MEKKNPLIKFKLDILDNMKKKTSNIISQFNSLYELIEHNYKNINECSKNLLNEIDNDITWLENYENFSIEENNKKEQQFCNEIKLIFNEYYEKIEFIIENIFTKKIITLKEDLNNLLDGLSNFNPTKINSLSNDISKSFTFLDSTINTVYVKSQETLDILKKFYPNNHASIPTTMSFVIKE